MILRVVKLHTQKGVCLATQFSRSGLLCGLITHWTALEGPLTSACGAGIT